MRRRFLLSVLISDLVALVLGFVVASLVVFGTPLLWEANPPGGASIWPLLALGVAGLLIGSYGSLRMWAQGAPRPSYGRALAIVGFTAAFTAAGLVIARDFYFSRTFLAYTFGVFLIGALGHRALRRRRPWTERLILVTGEKSLSDDLRNAAHADVLAVYDPAGDPPSNSRGGCDPGDRPSPGDVRPDGAVRFLVESGGLPGESAVDRVRGIHRATPDGAPGRRLGVVGSGVAERVRAVQAILRHSAHRHHRPGLGCDGSVDHGGRQGGLQRARHLPAASGRSGR